MSVEMSKVKNTEPLEDYKLQAVFQRRLRKQKPQIRKALNAMHDCCRKIAPGNGLGGVEVVSHVNHNDSKAGVRTGFHGTTKCHNLWACPVCSARLLIQKARTLTAFLGDNPDLAAFMVTFTIPHTRRMGAAFTIKKFKQVWRQAMHGTVEKRQRDMIETIGTVTSNEVTVSSWGFHYHRHVLYILPKENWDKVEDFCRLVIERWNGALKMHFKAFEPGRYGSGDAVYVSRKRNGKIMQVTDGRYLHGYGSELYKKRKGSEKGKRVRGTRTLFDLITGSDEDFDLLCEWLMASRRMHRVTLSRGLGRLLDKYAFEQKKIYFETSGLETSVVGVFTPLNWKSLIEAEIDTGLELRLGVLSSAVDGYDSVVEFLARRCPHIQFQRPTRQISNSPAPDENPLLDKSVRERLRQFSAAKDACIHEDILTFGRRREAKIAEVRLNYAYGKVQRVEMGAGAGNESGAADIG